ncbi:DUF4754 family protein, partial [Shigella flexneri]|uniref:DUF4754 family protein n=3 Tax=Enterobacteriaceae TaxID=543 RepID=UPI000E5D87BF
WQPEFTDKTLSRKPGAVHAERAARDSLTRAIRSLYDVAFYADDLDALNELSELICAAVDLPLYFQTSVIT